MAYTTDHNEADVARAMGIELKPIRRHGSLAVSAAAVGKLKEIADLASVNEDMPHWRLRRIRLLVGEVLAMMG